MSHKSTQFVLILLNLISRNLSVLETVNMVNVQSCLKLLQRNIFLVTNDACRSGSNHMKSHIYNFHAHVLYLLYLNKNLVDVFFRQAEKCCYLFKLNRYQMTFRRLFFSNILIHHCLNIFFTPCFGIYISYVYMKVYLRILRQNTWAYYQLHFPFVLIY